MVVATTISQLPGKPNKVSAQHPDRTNISSSAKMTVTVNLGNPRTGVLFMFWRASHPSLGRRIEFANDYRPWEQGDPLRYGGLFRGSSRDSPSKLGPVSLP
ncbi:MAG: hypothetical protein ABR915_01070 [Thermoguttaceae bacterium]|jgi:hypothetical protein